MKGWKTFIFIAEVQPTFALAKSLYANECFIVKPNKALIIQKIAFIATLTLGCQFYNFYY